MAVPFLDLKAQYKTIQADVEKAVLEVCRNQQFILGKTVEEFEKAFAAYCGSKHAVGVASGTDALLLALKALEIGPGDEVITTPFSFYASAGAISLTGARPVFADIDPATFNIDPAKIPKKITKKTKAILPVHLFGLPADMKPILELARKHGIAVVEDACQAVGAYTDDKKAGALGDFGCFSFFPTKNLGGFGDGGAITTQNEKLAQKLRMLREHGSREKYYSDLIGANSRLDALQAAVLQIKLKQLDRWTIRRNQNAAFYAKQLSKLPLILPSTPAGCLPVYHQYTVQAEHREKLIEHLREKGIGFAIYYPVPLHRQKCYASLGYKKGDFPVAEAAAEKVLSLPIYPELTPAQLKEVVAALEEFYVSVV